MKRFVESLNTIRDNLPQTIEARDRRNRYIVRPLAAVALTGALIGAGTALHESGNSILAGSETTQGTLDETITHVTILDDARVRSGPHVANAEYTNILNTIELTDTESITISTPNGAYTSQDQNGQWVGIHAEDLALEQTEGADVYQIDADGIVWINEQRASYRHEN